MNEVAEPKMTKAEIASLTRLVRQGARVRKSGIEAHQAELLCRLEAEVAAEYPPDDPRWAEITEAAQAAVKEADDRIAQLCDDLGIRREFRPRLEIGWRARGENAHAGRRSELRKVGQTRIAAMGKAAKLEIDKDALGRETELVAGSLSTAEAKAFLEAMPTLEALMPPVRVQELEADAGAPKPDDRFGDYW